MLEESEAHDRTKLSEAIDDIAAGHRGRKVVEEEAAWCGLLLLLLGGGLPGRNVRGRIRSSVSSALVARPSFLADGLGDATHPIRCESTREWRGWSTALGYVYAL